MGKPLPILRPTSFESIVALYVVEKRRAAEQEREFHARLPTLDEAARQAALALTPEGKRHSHQTPFRIKQETLDAWAERVRANSDTLASATTFEDLHDGLEALKLKGVGPLVIYDTAYRLGAKLGLEPRLVYLHSGTLEGAVLLGFSKKCRTLEPEQLPPPFRELRPYEIEDCLCIYKKDIARIVGASTK
jgi:hypothetical protein